MWSERAEHWIKLIRYRNSKTENNVWSVAMRNILELYCLFNFFFRFFPWMFDRMYGFIIIYIHNDNDK